MKSRVSKLVSMVCVVSMLISALPVAALAADEEHTHDESSVQVYNIGGDTQFKDVGTMQAPVLNAAAPAADAAANPDYIHNFDTQADTINGIYTSIVGKFAGDAKYGLPYTYNGITLSKGLKMESSTSVKFTAPEDGKMILVLSTAGKSVKLDGQKTGISGNVYTWDVTAGSHELTKDTTNTVLVYMEFQGSCPGHTYTQGKTKVVKAATCTEAGTSVKLCDTCEAEGESVTVPALDHDWTNGAVSIVTAATCSSKGLKSTKCARCNETKAEEIPATGTHNFSGGVCTVCSMRESDKNACSGSHTMTAGTGRPATCTEAGFTAETCSRCGMTVKTPVPAKGHDWTGTWTVSKPATCTVKGEETLACKNGCDEKQTRETNMIPHTDRDNDGNCDVCGNLIGSPLQGAGGWMETIYVETSQFKAAEVTEVSWTGAMSGDMGPGNLYQYDMDFLVRTLNGKTRIDIPGLRPGTYNLTVKANGTNYTAEGLEVKAYDRSGYAHWNYTEGVGAYRDDGILKDEAIVLYVTEQNKNTVELEIPGVVSVQGIGNILNSVGQESSENPGQCKRTSGGKTYWGIANENKDVLKLLADRDIPLVVRIIGNVSSAHPAPKAGWIEGLTAYNSWDYGGSAGDNGNMARMKDCKNITIEGIGPDACVDGWGFHFMASSATPDYGKNFEVRNIAFRNVPEDCIGMEGIQEGSKLTAPILHGWVHNCSFYAPSISPAAESDKGGGDGACDFKRGEYFTMDYCYYEGYHKTNLVGSSDSSLQYNITWHHNHYKNCESRGPLGRQANMHIYNCIYEGQTSYAMQTRANCYIVSEYNSFVGSKNSQQVKGGGPIKSFNDVFSGCIDALDGTIVDSMSTPVSSSNKNAGFELDKSLSYIPDMDYHLDRSIGAARQNILAYTGVMKPAAEMVEPDDIDTSTVRADRKPTKAVVLPYDKDINATNAVVKGEKDNIIFNITKVDNTQATFGKDEIGQNIVFMTDKVTDITMTPGGSALISLVNQDGQTVAENGATAKNCPPGLYYIQPSGQSKGIYKEGKLAHLKITEVAGAAVHTHSYVAGDVVKPATCTLQGIQKWVCSCGEFITKPIPMTEHTDADGDGLCDVCKLNLNNAGPVDPDVPTVEVESVTVSPASLTIQQGDSVRLTATIVPANATNKRVAYSSSDPKVASVGTSGVVTGNTPGTAVITVMASNNKSAMVNVTVTGVSTKTYTFNAVDQGQQPADQNPAAEGMKVGTENFFTVTGTNAVWRTKNKDTDKTTASLQLGSKRSSGMSFTIPAGSTARSVDISFGSTNKSNTSAIVLVDASGKRMVNAKETTMSQVTGTSGGKATYNNLPAGTYTIYAPKDVDPSEVGLENWTDPANTSDPSNPNLRGARIMTVTVVQATATGTEYKPVTKVTLDKKTLELEVGQQYTLTAALEPVDASNTIVTWVSSTPTVARINGGTVRANAVGTTTIRATAYSGVYDECVVTVKPSSSAPVKVTKITILGADSVETEDVITLSVNVEPDDATNHEVDWTVNDNDVAKINSAGELTGLADGKVVVTATAKDGSGVKAQKVITVGAGVQAADKTGLENVISRAQTAIDRVPVAEKAEDVAVGSKWVSQADHDAFQAAIDAAQAVYDKKNATADEISAATTALTAAMTTFAGKAQDGTQGGSKPTPTDKTYTLTGDEVFGKLTPNGKDTSSTPHDIYNFAENEKLTNQGTEGFFTIYGGKNKSNGTPGTKIDYSKKTIGDYSGTYRINFNGGVKVEEEAIGFTTTGPATVKVWWVGGTSSEKRAMGILDASGNVVATSTETCDSNESTVSTLTLADAGTYYLGGSPKKNNIFKVEVTVTETSGGDTPTPPTPSDVDRTKLDAALADAKKALDEATVSVDGSDIAPDKSWVTEADKAPLQSAITLAALAFTQDEIDEAVAELKSALAEFELAKKAGTKIDKPDEPTTPDTPSGGGGGGGSSTPAISGTTLTVDGKEQTASTVGQLSDAQASALSANAQKSGTDIEITVDASADATDVELNVSTKALKNMAAKTDVALVVKTPMGDARLPHTSVADLGGSKSKAVNITVEKTENGLKVTVTVGGKVVDTLVGGVTAVTDASANGSVAYQVTADGERLIKKSYVENGKIYANLPGSGEIVLKDNAKTFRDVDGSWAKEAIDFATSRELFNGVNGLDFAPNQAMTRSMLVTVLYRLEGAESGEKSKFADVAADSWYTEAVAWANAEGIVSGKSETLFGPDDDITREQLATILYRYAVKLCGMEEVGEDGKALEKYPDAATVSDFAADGMAWAVEQGIIGGRGDGTLAPGGFASRAEVATMLMRFIKTII